MAHRTTLTSTTPPPFPRPTSDRPSIPKRPRNRNDARIPHEPRLTNMVGIKAIPSPVSRIHHGGKLWSRARARTRKAATQVGSRSTLSNAHFPSRKTVLHGRVSPCWSGEIINYRFTTALSLFCINYSRVIAARRLNSLTAADAPLTSLQSHWWQHASTVYVRDIRSY